jgi:hypothetical protein
MKYSHHPLPDDYKKIIQRREKFVLTIVGKDPYPTAPTGIPFCKNSWEELLRDNCSGSHVIASLGIEIEEAKRKMTTSQFFNELAMHGVAFLNASYHFLETSNIPKKDFTYIEKALETNSAIIEKSEHVILCGQAKVLLSYFTDNGHMKEFIHPDTRNRGTRKEAWESIWSPNRLKVEYNLDIKIGANCSSDTIS